MKKLCVCTFFIGVAMQMANAQIAQNNTNTLDALNDLAFFVDVNNIKYEEAEGSPYLFESFVPARINQIKTSHAVRFNIVEDVVEFKLGDGTVRGLSKNQDYRIVLLNGSDRIFVSLKAIDDQGKSVRVLVEEVFCDEHFAIYKKKRRKFQDAKPAKSGYEPEKPAKFINLDDAFYILSFAKEKDLLYEIPRKKKLLKQFFGNEYPHIEKFAKKNDLKFNAIEDLKAILTYSLTLKSG